MISAFVHSLGISATESSGIGPCARRVIDVKFTALLFWAVREKQEMNCMQQVAMNWNAGLLYQRIMIFKVMLNQRVSNCIGFLFVCFASADNSLWKLWIYFWRHFDESDETKPQVLNKIYQPKSCIVKAFYKGLGNILVNLDFIIIHIRFMNCTWYAEDRALVQMTGKVTFSLLEKKNFT